MGGISRKTEFKAARMNREHLEGMGVAMTLLLLMPESDYRSHLRCTGQIGRGNEVACHSGGPR